MLLLCVVVVCLLLFFSFFKNCFGRKFLYRLYIPNTVCFLFPEPDCPTDVNHVDFSANCLYQSGEKCFYSCEDGYLTTSRSMICVGEVWNVPEPCKGIFRVGCDIHSCSHNVV